ncbi:protein-L-isoaspartate(D-aspartate) O-methyltransferase [uncultured Bartonella sp.]|uniref:protein-L-isoaspartate(D-aspartate) O-methyltransferase n=1 Tax=uncultured Bartonella sp. TaxID=104108 RepID=UPI00263964CA|nr:protein-L-isoaspartate(D-aspartate) O-methyltransferase [uncultured Bartonella sp.]
MQSPLSEREELASLVLKMRGRGLNDLVVFSALERTPRRSFISAQFSDSAYDNKVVPIECGEYIERLEEQLYILSALALEKKHRVLEIGTGSGFTAALIARLAGRVTTIERYKTLCDSARQRFHSLGIDNIVLRQMDGSRVLSGSGPYDRILVWPSRADEPQAFLDLLAANGILIQAIGPDEGEQMVVRYRKTGSRFERTDMFRVRYQPFIEGVAAIL